MRERSIKSVPVPVLVIMAAGLVLQLAWSALQPRAVATAEQLPAPMKLEFWRAASFGDPIPLAKVLMLWLQCFDNGSVTIPFRNLDYPRVTHWLDTALSMDSKSQYPLLSATRLYAEVADTPRQRLMLDFVYQKFLEDPKHRWRWLAQSVVIAKHRLNDLPLALKFAQALADNTNNNTAPSWARQMHIFIREDLGELESAQILLGGLIESGSITDVNELRFLSERLKSLQQQRNDETSATK
jgi:hypothetical protein